MRNNKQAAILTPQEVDKIKTPLTESWKKAAGILKGKREVDALNYQRQVRQEWEERFRGLEEESLSYLKYGS